MSTLKSLVAKANNGLSLRSKKSNKGFGLDSFLAASTDQMLMTRGGYGSGGGGSLGGFSSEYNSLSSVGPGSGLSSGISNIGNGIANSVSSAISRYNNSAFARTTSSIINNFFDNLEPSDLIKIFSKGWSTMLDSQKIGEGSDCPPRSWDPKCRRGK